MRVIDFRTRFPEFARLPDATIVDAIARGAAQSDSTVFGPFTDESTGYLAAHFLALSPYGQQARLAPEKGDTTYMTHWRRLATFRAAGRNRITASWCGNNPGGWGF